MSHQGQYNDDIDDDASAEGANIRSFFRSNSSSSSSEDGENSNEEDCNVSTTDKSKEVIEEVVTFMDNIDITQKVVGGSIADRIWPGAEYLAKYVLDTVRDGKCPCSDETIVTNEQRTKPDKTLDYELKFNENVSIARNTIQSFLCNQPTSVSSGKNDLGNNKLSIIELGAGVGLTGIKLATELECNVLLTDLEIALPLLEKNISMNCAKFRIGQNAVSAKRLSWGTDDWQLCFNTIMDENLQNKLLILAADCVYFEELHDPFELTIASLLSNAPDGSICLIASERRWKRDNTFFSNIGKLTRTKTHQLKCVCVQETITRLSSEKRTILRVYCIQWVKK
jgi:hypothetical protein